MIYSAACQPIFKQNLIQVDDLIPFEAHLWGFEINPFCAEMRENFHLNKIIHHISFQTWWFSEEYCMSLRSPGQAFERGMLVTASTMPYFILVMQNIKKCLIILYIYFLFNSHSKLNLRCLFMLLILTKIYISKPFFGAQNMCY